LLNRKCIVILRLLTIQSRRSTASLQNNSKYTHIYTHTHLHTLMTDPHRPWLTLPLEHHAGPDGPHLPSTPPTLSEQELAHTLALKVGGPVRDLYESLKQPLMDWRMFEETMGSQVRLVLM